jgi:uncharacterized alkaline shock family protein YloU
MNSITENELGKIIIDDEVIACMAGLAAMDCYGVVGMAAKSVKDGIVRLLKLDSLTRGIRIERAGDLLTVELHIIVVYGTNISAIADSLISTVKYRVEEHIGVKVGQTNIFVEGIRVDR